MKKILTICFILIWAVISHAVAGFTEVSEPMMNDDGSNFEPIEAELDSEPGERASEVPASDETPRMVGVGIDF